LKVLTLKRKIILGIVAIYCFAALWDGHWVAGIVLAGIAYWYVNKPYTPKSNLIESNPASKVDDDYDDVDDSKPTPAGFNQMSSTGSTFWTDYDEHIHNIK